MEEPILINNEIPYARNPTLIGDGKKNLYVSFLGGIGIPLPHFTRSIDGGKTWSAPQLITTNGTPFVRIATNGRDIYAVSTHEVYPGFITCLYVSKDQGLSWKLYRNDILPIGGSQSIAVGADGTVHIVWRAGSQFSIWYVQVKDSYNPLTPILLAGKGFFGMWPMLKVLGPKIHVTWVDYRDSPFLFNGDVYYIKSDDFGTHWSTPAALTTSHRVYPGTQEMELNSQNPNQVYVAWQDSRRFDPMDVLFDAYLIESQSGGSTWGIESDLTSANFPSAHISSLSLVSHQNRLRVYFTENPLADPWKLWSIQR